MLANLKVIAMIPRGGKLCVRQGQLCLEPVDSLQRVRRWLLGDSRSVALSHVRTTVNGAIELSSTLLKLCTISGVPSGQAPLPLWTLQRLTREMQHCDTGFKNLRATYANDSLLIANLEVLAERLNEHEHDVTRVVSNITAGPIVSDTLSLVHPPPTIIAPVDAPTATVAIVAETTGGPVTCARPQGRLPK